MSLHVVIAGASGFLGSHLTTHLRDRGHRVTRLVRREASRPDESTWDPYAARVDRDLIESCDVVVNLAGTPTAGNPHSGKWARELRKSRVATTGTLATAIGGSGRKPAFLAGNAVGWYGDHGGEPVDEGSPSVGDTVMTEVSRAWQDAAQPAADGGARLCLLRTAPVMDRTAPPLKQMRLAWKAGLGARLGGGRQYFPIVSLPDWLGAVELLAGHETASGPVNLCCPATPTNAEFTDALARALGRKAFLVAPAKVIELAAGRLAPELLGSMNLRPAALESLGYSFRDRDVDAVLATALA